MEGLDLAGIDWLIAGGESGPTHRAVRQLACYTFVAELARQVLDLGDNPVLLKAHSDYRRAGIDQALTDTR